MEGRAKLVEGRVKWVKGRAKLVEGRAKWEVGDYKSCDCNVKGKSTSEQH